MFLSYQNPENRYRDCAEKYFRIAPAIHDLILPYRRERFATMQLPMR
jgi:hypothetical protein